jgi:hypothetical protein
MLNQVKNHIGSIFGLVLKNLKNKKYALTNRGVHRLEYPHYNIPIKETKVCLILKYTLKKL